MRPYQRLCGHQCELSLVKLLLVAAVALIDRDGRVLVGKRRATTSFGGFWEFPGGKIEPGETPEAALVRELQEELAIDTWGSCLAPLTFASHDYGDFHLLMPLYACRKWDGFPQCIAHDDLKWARPRELTKYAMLPANAAVVPILRDWLN